MILRTLAVLMLALGASAVHADTFFVEPAKGSGVADADKESVGELIRVAVPDSGQHSVVSAKEGATWTLSPTLMKLGDAYVLTLQKKDKTGRAVFSEKMKASSLSEMDTVASRLTRAVLSETKVASTADVTNITHEEEMMNTRRFTATRHWVIGFGPGWGTNLASKGGGFTFLIGFLWGLDPNFSVNLTWSINSGSKGDDSSFSDFSLGGDYHFSRGKHSPFLGARVGYASARADDSCNVLSIGCSQDRATGWAGTLNAGMKFFRTSTVNMAVLSSYTQVFDRTSLGSPSLTTIALAVYY